MVERDTAAYQTQQQCQQDYAGPINGDHDDEDTEDEEDDKKEQQGGVWKDLGYVGDEEKEKEEKEEEEEKGEEGEEEEEEEEDPVVYDETEVEGNMPVVPRPPGAPGVHRHEVTRAPNLDEVVRDLSLKQGLGSEDLYFGVQRRVAGCGPPCCSYTSGILEYKCVCLDGHTRFSVGELVSISINTKACLGRICHLFYSPLPFRLMDAGLSQFYAVIQWFTPLEHLIPELPNTPKNELVICCDHIDANPIEVVKKCQDNDKFICRFIYSHKKGLFYPIDHGRAVNIVGNALVSIDSFVHKSRGDCLTHQHLVEANSIPPVQPEHDVQHIPSEHHVVVIPPAKHVPPLPSPQPEPDIPLISTIPQVPPLPPPKPESEVPPLPSPKQLESEQPALQANVQQSNAVQQHPLRKTVTFALPEEQETEEDMSTDILPSPPTDSSLAGAVPSVAIPSVDVPSVEPQPPVRSLDIRPVKLKKPSEFPHKKLSASAALSVEPKEAAYQRSIDMLSKFIRRCCIQREDIELCSAPNMNLLVVGLFVRFSIPGVSNPPCYRVGEILSGSLQLGTKTLTIGYSSCKQIIPLQDVTNDNPDDNEIKLLSALMVLTAGRPLSDFDFPCWFMEYRTSQAQYLKTHRAPPPGTHNAPPAQSPATARRRLTQQQRTSKISQS
ncbi:hypothetical protein Pelo_16429 [Pelomyxa schiedti]|nr:hypothetical protein Pelo_16429 [Pelomyxa schiedti]